jgi:hypothetical protein
MTTFDQNLKRAIADVKRGLKNIRKMGLRIEAHETETMIGETVQHGYVIDRIGNGICLQKHLFTIRQNGLID